MFCRQSVQLLYDSVCFSSRLCTVGSSDTELKAKWPGPRVSAMASSAAAPCSEPNCAPRDLAIFKIQLAVKGASSSASSPVDFSAPRATDQLREPDAFQVAENSVILATASFA